LERGGSASVSDRGRTLTSLGLAQEDAKRLNRHEDGVLLYVSCQQTAQTQRTADLLRASGAEEVGLLEAEEVGLLDNEALLQSA
jgi:hypothetical protein